jgi:eukaryotic-like serine/threonine-protein kinase
LRPIDVADFGITPSRASIGAVMEGRIIADRYRLERPIGNGAMGEVWLAQDLRETREVAIKLIKPTFMDDADVKGRFLREAQIAARIRNAHIVRTFDHGVTEDGRPFLTMEYFVGTSLRERLGQDGSLSIAEAKRLLADLCAGLEQAHREGLVHRDLKPENILLIGGRDDEDVKILDFGVAKAIGAFDAPVAGTGTGKLLGTPSYMSPEQVQGLRTVDHRTDLWALAVIVFECITGVRPFEDKPLGRLFAHILAGPIPIPSIVAPEALFPPEVDAWMARALSCDPADRFASASELAAAFAKATATTEAKMATGDESEIRSAFEKGDLASATTAALKQFGPEVLRHLAGSLGDAGLADDAFSDFYARLWVSLPGFQWRCSFRTWAFVLARRAAADVRRAEHRTRRHRKPLTNSQISAVAEQIRTETLPLLRTEARSALARLRDELPHDDKMLLILRIDRGLAWDELARVFLEKDTPGDEEIRRESARLRKRFQLVKTRLRERAKATGLLGGDCQ